MVAVLVILGVIVYHVIAYRLFSYCAAVRAEEDHKTAVGILGAVGWAEVALATTQQEDAENRLIRAKVALSKLAEGEDEY